MDPLTWVYLALLAAGTAAQDQAVRKVDRETAKAQAENRDIRAKREKDSTALAKDSEQAVLQTKDKQAKRAKELAAQYQQPQQTYDAAGTSSATGMLDPVMSGAGSTTIDAANAAAAKAKLEGDYNANLMGQMGAYGSTMEDAAATLGQNAADVRRNEKSMNDWTNFVLPMRLAGAAQSGKDWSTTGDVLKLAAMVTGMAAMTNPATATTPGGAATTVDSTGIGQSIQASKLPQGLDWSQPMMQTGGGTPFGSTYGVADAEAGYLASQGMEVPQALASRALAAPAAARTFNPLSSGLMSPRAPATGMPIDPYGMGMQNQMFDPNFWRRLRKPVPVTF